MAWQGMKAVISTKMRTGLRPSNCASAAGRRKARAAHILHQPGGNHPRSKTSEPELPWDGCDKEQVVSWACWSGCKARIPAMDHYGAQELGRHPAHLPGSPCLKHAEDSEHAEDLHNCFSSWQAAWTFTWRWPLGGKVSLVNDKDFLLL